MKSIGVEFKEDERALLDLLHARAGEDHCVQMWDSELIRDLGLGESELAHRFFAPKMRLVAAGAISLFIGGSGIQVIRLNMPERSEESKRYVFTIVPLEMIKRIRGEVKDYRNARLKKQAAPEGISTTGAAETASASPQNKLTDEQKLKKQKRKSMAQKKAQGQLGVRRLEVGPVRPPLAEKSVGAAE